MRIINVIQLRDGSITNLDSFPVLSEETNETRFYVEKFCCELAAKSEEDEWKCKEFEDYFSEGLYDNGLGYQNYQIAIVNSYIYE